MTREEAKELLPIIQAYAEGKTVEHLDGDKWVEIEDPLFCAGPKRYRIKSELKYRPFNNQEECWKEMQKHHPFGWVKKKGHYVNITRVSEDCSYDGYFKIFTFADGTPFGIKDE